MPTPDVSVGAIRNEPFGYKIKVRPSNRDFKGYYFQFCTLRPSSVNSMRKHLRVEKLLFLKKRIIFFQDI